MKPNPETVQAVQEVFASKAGKAFLAALEDNRTSTLDRLLGAQKEDAEALRGEVRAIDKIIKFINQYK